MLALQTIVSREIDPRDPAVITVGVFKGGTQFNIIPDEVSLALSVRSFRPEVRAHLLTSIERVIRGEAAAGGAPREPLIKVTPGAHATYNDPELTHRLADAVRRALGLANVVEIPPKTVSEDFSDFALAGVPSSILFVGAVNPSKFAGAGQSATPLPGLHSPLWAPDYVPTLKTAMVTETTALLEELGR